jgi:hypothetical protein
MFAGIDLRLLAIIVTIAIFVYKNSKAGVIRGERQEMRTKDLDDKIKEVERDSDATSKKIDDAVVAQRAVCEKRLEVMEQTYLRKDQFYAYMKPIEDNLRSLIEAELPVELAKIQPTQAQILTALKRLEDKFFIK